MAKAKASYDDQANWLKSSLAAEKRRFKEDLTRMLPPDDEEKIFYPQGRLEQPYICVASNRDTFERFSYDKPLPHHFLLDRMTVYNLQAKQFALVLPDGRTVCWWGWELR